MNKKVKYALFVSGAVIISCVFGYFLYKELNSDDEDTSTDQTATVSKAKLEPLPPMGANTNSVFCIGISDGSSSCMIHSIVSSKSVKGSALFCGYPYGHATYKFKSRGSPINPDKEAYYAWATDYIDKKEQAGLIDQTTNLKSQAVYIFQGEQDFLVYEPFTRMQQGIYEHYQTQHIKYVKDPDVGHNFPNNSHYDAFSYIYSSLNKPFKEGVSDDELLTLGEWRTFSQEEIVANLSLNINETQFKSESDYPKQDGYVYIPNACKTKSCDIHIVLSGTSGEARFYCADSQWGDYGHRHLAAANDFILLCPQEKYRWYEGQEESEPEHYIDNKGTTERIFRKMIERLGEPRQ